GSKNERRLDLSILKSHLENPTTGADLKRIGTTSAADLISRFYLGPADVTNLSAGAKLNTDDNALIEFNAPRRGGTAEETVVRNLKQLLAYASSPLDYLDGSKSSPGSEVALLTQAALGAVKRDDRERAEQFANYSLQFSDSAQAHGILGELKQSRGDEAG